MPILLGTIASSYLKIVESFNQIATTTLTATASTISFTSITSSYKHLQLRFWGKTNNNAEDWITLYFNNDQSTDVYSRASARGENATATGGYTTNSTFSYLTQSDTGSTSNFSSAVLDIPYYTNTNFEKVAWSHGGFENGTSSRFQFFETLYKNTSAINSIYLGQEGSGGFKIGTRVSLYGIG